MTVRGASVTVLDLVLVSGASVAVARRPLVDEARNLLGRLAEKDPETAAHASRVAARAVAVGLELGLATRELRSLELAALVHDVGKLCVPIDILGKQGKLDDEEMELVRRHPELGASLLAALGFPQEVRRPVRDHHERLDGSGYPLGRGAGELDLASRIVAVCDVFDALTAARPYHAPWSLERALGLLRGEAARTFDPVCVGALDEVLTRPSLALAA